MYTSIVVPLDGSDFGMCALPVTLTLARRSQARVHMVHVREPIVFPEGGPKVYDGLDRALRADVTAMATRLSREAAVQVDAVFLEGPAVPTIQRYLEEHGHDLLVMMTHGRGGLSRWWLGSIADGLIRHTSVPVLLLRQESAWLTDAAEPLFRRVLVPLDGSSVADQVLDHVMSLATPDVTVYVLLTVLVPGPLDDGHQRQTAWSYLEGVADELRKGEALVEVVVVTHPHAAQARHGARAAGGFDRAVDTRPWRAVARHAGKRGRQGHSRGDRAGIGLPAQPSGSGTVGIPSGSGSGGDQNSRTVREHLNPVAALP